MVFFVNSSLGGRLVFDRQRFRNPNPLILSAGLALRYNPRPGLAKGTGAIEPGGKRAHKTMGRMQAMAMAVLGGWLGATLLMWFVAVASFSTADRILRASNPQVTQATQPMGPSQTRVVLRYLASEINRTCFDAYGWAQVALAIFLLVLQLRQTPRDTIALALMGAMLGLVLVLTLIITPQIVVLGRSIDFVPRNPPPPELARFHRLHAAFTVLDGLKLLGGLALLARWIVAR